MSPTLVGRYFTNEPPGKPPGGKVLTIGSPEKSLEVSFVHVVLTCPMMLQSACEGNWLGPTGFMVPTHKPSPHATA